MEFVRLVQFVCIGYILTLDSCLSQGVQNHGGSGIFVKVNPDKPALGNSMTVTCKRSSLSSAAIEWGVDSSFLTKCDGLKNDICLPLPSGYTFRTDVSANEFNLTIAMVTITDCKTYECKAYTATKSERIIQLAYYNKSDIFPTEPGANTDGIISIITGCVLSPADLTIKWSKIVNGNSVDWSVDDPSPVVATDRSNCTRTCHTEEDKKVTSGFIHTEYTGRDSETVQYMVNVSHCSYQDKVDIYTWTSSYYTQKKAKSKDKSKATTKATTATTTTTTHKGTKATTKAPTTATTKAPTTATNKATTKEEDCWFSLIHCKNLSIYKWVIIALVGLLVICIIARKKLIKKKVISCLNVCYQYMKKCKDALSRRMQTVIDVAMCVDICSFLRDLRYDCKSICSDLMNFVLRILEYVTWCFGLCLQLRYLRIRSSAIWNEKFTLYGSFENICSAPFPSVELKEHRCCVRNVTPGGPADGKLKVGDLLFLKSDNNGKIAEGPAEECVTFVRDYSRDAVQYSKKENLGFEYEQIAIVEHVEGLAEGKLKEGDRILSINGKKKTFNAERHDEILSCQCSPCLELTIKEGNGYRKIKVHVASKEKSGIIISGNAVVSKIEPKSAAYSHVKVNDRILSVNGFSTTGLEVAEIQNMLDLKIFKINFKVTKDLTLLEIDPDLDGSFGFKTNAAVVVTDVSKKGPADGCGLKIGDKIVSIDGVKINSKSHEQLLKSSTGDSISLKIQKKEDLQQ